MTLPFARIDTFAENASHPDTGCEASKSCLACPLPRCLHDRPYVNRLQERNAAMLKDRQSMMLIEVAKKWGVATRTAFRAIERAKAHADGTFEYPIRDDMEPPGKISLEELEHRSIFRVRDPWPVLETK